MCKESPSVDQSLSGGNVDAVFRGKVLSELKNSCDPTTKKFAVKVMRFFKGCDFDNKEIVIVTTGSPSAMYGRSLNKWRKYLSSAHLRPHDTDAVQLWQDKKRREQITHTISVDNRNYNAE